MKLIKYAFINFLYASFLLINSCSSPTETKPIIPATDFIWEVDTLRFNDGQTYMESIQFFSPDLIYLTGWSSSSQGSIYKFDGESWNPEPFHDQLGGPLQGSFDLQYVFGLDKSDIWYGGSHSYINPEEACAIHYNGTTWEKIPIVNRGDRGVSIENIWGHSRNAIWFAGTEGEVYFWNGTEIKKVDIPFDFEPAPDFYKPNWVTGNKYGDVYVAYWFGNGAVIDILKKPAGGAWEVIMPYYLNDAPRIWMSPSNTLWAKDGHPRYFKNGKWEWLLDGNPNFAGISGPSDNHLLFVDYAEGRVYYWNGSQMQEIKQLYMPDITYITTFNNGENAVVIGNWNWNTIVYRGSIK